MFLSLWFALAAEAVRRREKFDVSVGLGNTVFQSLLRLSGAPTALLLKSGGYFACLWNHRNLEDPIQKQIEDIIRSFIPSYGYGARRENQTEVIAASGLFEDIRLVEEEIFWDQTVKDTVEAWRSHATLHRQAGEKFGTIIQRIEPKIPS